MATQTPAAIALQQIADAILVIDKTLPQVNPAGADFYILSGLVRSLEHTETQIHLFLSFARAIERNTANNPLL